MALQGAERATPAAPDWLEEALRLYGYVAVEEREDGRLRTLLLRKEMTPLRTMAPDLRPLMDCLRAAARTACRM